MFSFFDKMWFDKSALLDDLEGRKTKHLDNDKNKNLELK